jgi:hypothetical protein
LPLMRAEGGRNSYRVDLGTVDGAQDQLPSARRPPPKGGRLCRCGDGTNAVSDAGGLWGVICRWVTRRLRLWMFSLVARDTHRGCKGPWPIQASCDSESWAS